MDQPIVTANDAASLRARKERLVAAIAEKKRRHDLGIQHAKGIGWVDVTTGHKLTDVQVMEREIAFSKGNPEPLELQNKVVVNKEWLKEALGADAYAEAAHKGIIKRVADWI